MYDIILDSMLDEMQDFGLVSQIVISLDCYENMSKKEINHLESLLDLNSKIKWMIVSDRKEYFAFKYSIEPCGLL